MMEQFVDFERAYLVTLWHQKQIAIPFTTFLVEIHSFFFF